MLLTNEHILIISVLFLLIGFILSYLIIPVIINVVKTLNLLEKVSDRSSHTCPVPSFGGVAFFIVILIALGLSGEIYDRTQVLALLPGVLIVFFTGLKDDLTGTRPITKIIMQLLASASLVAYPQFNIVDLNGFLGIHQISEWLMFPLSLVVIIFFINAFNLIDGIDGYAGLIGIVIFSFYAFIFAMVRDWLMLSVCVSMIGAFIAFLRYNFSKNGKKIFLGDTGSLLLGFVIITFVFYIISKDYAHQLTYFVPEQNLPYVLLAILFVPTFDASRVFITRLINHKSPFKADRSHMHHIILDGFEWSHKKTSFVIAVFNMLLVVLITFICHFNSQLISASLFVIIIVSITIFLNSLSKKIKKESNNSF